MSNFEKIYNGVKAASIIKSGSVWDTNILVRKAAKILEEAGEVAAEVLKLDGYKTSDESAESIKTKIRAESIDTLVTVLDLINSTDMTDVDVSVLVDAALNKWKRKHLTKKGIRERDLDHTQKAKLETLTYVSGQMTSDARIEEATKGEFKAKPIHPDRFGSFNSLYNECLSIRDLHLLPIKTDEVHAIYNNINRNDLNVVVEKMLFEADTEILLMKNKFPYWLPQDVDQHIVWIRPNVSRDRIESFIARSLDFLNVDKLISFERPHGITTPLIKGTITGCRHIHFWIETQKVS